MSKKKTIYCSTKLFYGFLLMIPYHLFKILKNIKQSYSIIFIIILTVFFNLNTIRAQDFFDQINLNCRRVHPSYCCSSRIQNSCFELCKQHPCHIHAASQPIELSQNKDFVNENHESQWQLNSKNFILNPQSNILNQLSPPNGIILPPPDTPLSIDSTVEIQQSKINELAKIDSELKFVNKFTTESPFPTLISLKPNQNMLSINNQPISMINSNDFKLKDSETQIHQKNNNNKKGLLNPPQLINSNENVETLKLLPLQNSKEEELTSQEMFKPKQIINSNLNKNSETLLEHIPPLPINPETTWIPLNFNIKPSLLNTSKAERTTFSKYNNIVKTTQITSVENLQQNSQLTNILETDNKIKNETTTNATPKGQISFSFKRRGDLPIPLEENTENKFVYMQIHENKIWANKNSEKILLPPIQMHNQNKTENGYGLFGNKIDVIIDRLINQETIDSISKLTKGRISRPVINNKQLTQLTTTFAPKIFQKIIYSTISSKKNNNECGTPPLFTPCVPLVEASERLLNCCKQKLMPLGCQELCRYDITQSEIKRTFDANKCGILNVATYLECASQNQDNLLCCKHRNIAIKSGPQCEVFCNPIKGLGTLGLQHLACQNVIGDLLQCHHSGIR